jgi:hypothetical protein
LDRNAIDIIVPVYKSVHLTTRCLNSLADQIQEIAGSNPRLIVINDSPQRSIAQQTTKVFRNANRIAMPTGLPVQARICFRAQAAPMANSNRV